MTASEEDIWRDQSERGGLQKAIADVETALPVSTPGTRRILENSLEGMKGRVATLDKKIGDAIHAREVQAQEQAATIAAQARKEARLSESEKQTYSGFLAKDFFTKQDFKSLDQFYSKSWDRLSEGGKDEMSHRVWEGVRHGEYEFKELPKEIQEKEAKRLYGKLTSPTIGQGSLASIPESDRSDFLQAYDAGSQKQIGAVLDRASFRRNVALDTSVEPKHQAVNAGKAADDNAILARNHSTQTDKPQGDSIAVAASKFDSINLKNLTLTDSSDTPSVAAVPDASGARVNGRSPA